MNQPPSPQLGHCHHPDEHASHRRDSVDDNSGNDICYHERLARHLSRKVARDHPETIQACSLDCGLLWINR